MILHKIYVSRILNLEVVKIYYRLAHSEKNKPAEIAWNPYITIVFHTRVGSRAMPYIFSTDLERSVFFKTQLVIWTSLSRDNMDLGPYFHVCTGVISRIHIRLKIIQMPRRSFVPMPKPNIEVWDKVKMAEAVKQERKREPNKLQHCSVS